MVSLSYGGVGTFGGFTLEQLEAKLRVSDLQMILISVLFLTVKFLMHQISLVLCSKAN